MRAIRDRLREVYGVPLMAPHEQPLDELVLTVLSQNTNDRNRDVAYERLRERFPRWEAVRAAPVEEVEEAIRPGGISKVKSRAHPGDPARRSTARADGLDLGWLRDGPGRAKAQAYLCALPGVGRKTAACVLLFSYGLPRRAGGHPRLARRHAPAPVRPGAPFEEVHDAMLALTPPGEELELHVNLLRHGRRTCHARRRPPAPECPLRRMCPSRRA